MRWLPLLILIALLLPAPTPALAQPAVPAFHYLALGNSLAVGEEAPANTDGQPGYPANLFQMIQGLYPNATMTNLGVSGETSSSFLGGQIGAAESAIAGQCPNLITLDIGGNDVANLLTNQNGADAAFRAFASNFATILDRLHNAAASCPARIVTMTYYNPYPGLEIPPHNAKLADQWIPRLNTIIRSVAGSRGVAVAPVATAFAAYDVGALTYVNPAIYTNPLLKVPWLPGFERNVDFHPRPAGHALIADLLYQTAGLLPPVPKLDALPDLAPANISYTLPWTCAVTCMPGQVTVMAATTEAPATPQAWLSQTMHERVARPIVCWSINLTQATLNAYALWLNTSGIPAFNSLYKLLYLLLILLTTALHSLVYILESSREIAWLSYGVLVQIAANTTQVANTGGAAVAQGLASWLGAAKGVQYMVGLYMETIPGVFTVLGDLENHKPTQVTQIESFWALEALRGILIGIEQSKLGWWLAAQYGLFCLDTGLHITDELKEL